MEKGIILGLSHSNILINDIFLFLQKYQFANYTNGCIPYSSDKNTVFSNWFYKNFMVFKPDKCSFMLLGVKDELQTDFESKKVLLKIAKTKKS